MILRVAIGVLLIAQSVDDLAGHNDAGVGARVVGVLAVACGVLLVIGYLTPIIGVFVILISLYTVILSLSAPSPCFVNPALAGCVIVAIVIAILCLGPGAFSIDARLFGPREIVISDSAHPPEP